VDTDPKDRETEGGLQLRLQVQFLRHSETPTLRPEFRRNSNLPKGQANSPFDGKHQLAVTSPAGGRNLNRN